MDLQMPAMDGYQATRHLKRLMQEREIVEIPIVALTANNSEEDKKACIEAGMCTYLCQPLKENEVQAVLNKFINKKILIKKFFVIFFFDKFLNFENISDFS